jgi:hypothetical protein
MRRFVSAYASAYAEQGETLDVMMGSVSVPEVAEVVREIRGWRRQRLREIVRRADREGSLEISAKDAVEVAYLATAYNTLATLVRDAGLKPAAARDLLVATVDRALFSPG